ncbi:MAG TPA: hypothetical protein VK685_10590 [Candidatus Acidoferrum sp.]|jgi:hypothetical protein|nr:hypothetical protein [Candidatus Acidoferrum sp.]
MNTKTKVIGTAVVCVLLVATAVSVIAKDPLSGFKQFEAMGTAAAETCSSPVAMTGSIRGNVVGTGTYHLCLLSPGAAPKGGVPAANGTLVFTDEDGNSFTLDVAAIMLQNSTYAGTYVLDQTQNTGKFVNELLSGSGELEFSNTGTNDTIFLDGVLVGK